MTCECIPGPDGHAAFCPERVSRPEPVRCIGITRTAPSNRRCMSCGAWGQTCDRRAPLETINGLIERSSIGAALRDIKERGLEAHLKDLERETDKPWRRRG